MQAILLREPCCRHVNLAYIELERNPLQLGCCIVIDVCLSNLDGVGGIFNVADVFCLRYGALS